MSSAPSSAAGTSIAASFPYLTIIAPDIINDQINSSIDLAEQNGSHYLDRWVLFNSPTGCMCGSPEVEVINDAYQKGIRNFDLAKAYDYSVVTCEKDGNGRLGYNVGEQSVAVSLENDFDDWNLSQLAASLGKADDGKKYAAAFQNYRLLFDPAIPWTYDKLGKTDHPDWKGWFHGKDASGNWDGWDGLTSGKGGMESSLFQTGWFVPEDIAGLTKLLGGKDLFIAKLSDFFDRTPSSISGTAMKTRPTNRATSSRSFSIASARHG